MRIDTPSPYRPQLDELDSSKTRSSGRRAAAGGADNVTVSRDSQIAGEALRAAADRPEDRAAKVAEAQRLYASGELGTDLERLADRLLEALIEP